MQTITRASLTLSSPTTVDLRCAPTDRMIAAVIDGRQYIRAGNVWRYPLRRHTLDQLVAGFPTLDIAPEVREQIGRLEERDRKVRLLKDAGWQSAVPVAPMPIKTKPYQHQVLAFNLCMELLA